MQITTADIPESEIELTAMRASGPGGQNVNKVSTAIHLRFDIAASSLPAYLQQKLQQLEDSRVTADGVIVIKAQRFRSQEKNRQDALDRLDEMLAAAQHVRKQRRSTRPTRSSVKRRLDTKKKHGDRKKMRGPVQDD